MKRMFVLVFAVLGLILSACTGSPAADAPQEVVVTGTDLAYDTERIEVEAGRPVALTLRNDGALEHDFSVMHIPADIPAAEEEEDGHDMGHMDEMPELHVSAMPGESNSVTFTPTEAGEYHFFCTVEGHEAAGMSGTLVVTSG